MKKKMLAAAIASALAVPSAFAAIDDAGMKYTSASEGFYGSLRFALRSEEDNDTRVAAESSRLGVQGDVDVGHGNTAFYRGEWAFNYDGSDNNSPFSTRLGYVGMRGAYGSVRFGQIWSADYDYVTSLTDVANNESGNLAPRFRVKNALRYDSPDIQGFNFSLQVQALNQEGRLIRAEADPTTTYNEGSAPVPFDFAGNDLRDVADTTLADNPDTPAVGDELLGMTIADFGEYLSTSRFTDAQRDQFRANRNLELATTPTAPAGAGPILNPVTGLQTPAVAPSITTTDAVTEARDPDDGNDFDSYILAASYSIRGVDLAATYVSNQAPDGDPADEDESSWGLGGAYGQDNWRVGYLYWDTSDYLHANGSDLTGHSFSGQVSFDKVTLRAVYDTQELEPAVGGSHDTVAFLLEAQYSFSSKARAYATYKNVDRDANGAGFFGGDPNPDPEDSDLFYVAYRVDF